MKRHGGVKIAATGLIALAMCGMTVGTSHAQSILGRTTGHPFTILVSWNFPDGLNPLEPNSLTGNVQGMIDPPLAYVSRIDHADKIPMIASRWKAKGHTVYIWLNPKARWSNGKPVTIQDVKFSLELSEYYDQWWLGYAKGIRIINKHEIAVTNDYPMFAFEPSVLNMTPIYPASEYARFMPKNIYQIYQQSNSTNTKVATKASNELAAMYKKMEKVDPNTYLSCGPYILQSASTSEALFKINPYYDLAPKSNFPEIEVLNSTNPNLEYAWANESRFTLGGIPAYNPKLVQQWLSSSPYHKVYYTPSWYDVGINFNLGKYPYNILKVRQALAYLIDRHAVAHVADPLEASPAKYPVGYFNLFQLKQFSAKQMSTLHQYRYNPKKGVAMLKSVGFKQTSSGWLMPNGKPFAPSITTASGNTSWQFAAEVMASDLKKVGIHAKVYFPAATLFNEHFLKSGSSGYGISIMWEAFSLAPWNALGDALSYSDGISFNFATHSYTTTPGDVPLPLMKLPDGKTINVPKLAADYIFTGTPAQRRSTIWKITQAANLNLPQLQLFTLDRSVVYVDDEYYTGFPNGGSDPTSPKWNSWIDENFYGPNFLWWFQAGMVHPTKAN